MRRIVSSSVIFLALAFALVACGGGGGGGGEVSVNGLDGASNVAVDSVFKYTFSQAVDTSTVTNETFFIVESGEAVADVSKASFDPSECNNTQAIGAIVSCLSTTECKLDPTADLDSYRRYFACLSPDIKYQNGDPFEGFMATFMTAGTAFTVGGTVTGLGEGELLVLQNNGGDDLTITADGTFTFAAGLGDDAAYAVTVLISPDYKTCTVGNGTGTISDANVTNVSVVCSYSSFTVGGTVSGLNGTVVLQNNGGDNLTISASGPFTFATRVADGGAYAVTVRTQPTSPYQTCTVNNGSGTVTNANVTNVSVICATNSYTIGGTVGGLDGSGLVLQNNAGNDLPIAADGIFTFTTPVASGAAYTVTVKTQPTNLSQTCVVTNGTGTVTNANVTNVSVVCTTNTYSVGGALTGFVAGKTLVLLNNGGDPLTLSPITPSSPFTFSQKIADGSTFDVTVNTQPRGQTCVVSHGSGTINGADYFNVEVACIPNLYTIGGTVSGLDGTVVLRDNGGDDLTRIANGAFTFAGKIQDGNTYNVTVETQPSTQHCIVTNGSGTVDAANVTDVTVVCDYAGEVIFSTISASFSGDLDGIAGADELCNSAANKPDHRMYKAMVVDETNRYACTNASCSGPGNVQLDWVLKPNTTYYRPGLAVTIGTTNANGIFDFPLDNAIVTASSLIWTGFSPDWTTNVDNNCDGWERGDAVPGTYGASGAINSNLIYSTTDLCSISYGNLICVSSGNEVQWANSVTTGPSTSYFNDVSTNTGGAYAAGYIGGAGSYDFGNSVTTHGDQSLNVAIVKYDSGGTAQWANSVTGGGNNSIFLGSSAGATGAYAVGYLNNSGTFNFGNSVTAAGGNVGHNNVIIVKYDSAGGLAQWAKSVTGGGGNSEFYGTSTYGTYVYAVGHMTGAGPYNFGNGKTASGTVNGNVVIVKYDSGDGAAQWANSVSTGGGISEFYRAATDADGGVYAIGYITGTSSYNFGNSKTASGGAAGSNVVIVKYDSSGTAQWANSVTGGASDSKFYGVATDADGVYAVGYITGTDSYNFGNGVTATGVFAGSNVVIVKYDPDDGEAQWAQSVTSGVTSASFLGVSAGTDGVYTVGHIVGAGTFNFGNNVTASGANSDNVVIVSYDPDDGAAQWAQSVTGGGSTSTFDGVVTDADGVYAVGVINGTGTYGFGNSVTATGTAGINVVIVKYTQ